MKNSCDFYFLKKDLTVSGIIRSVKELDKKARFFSAGDIELSFFGTVPYGSNYLYRIKTGECFIIDRYRYSLSDKGEKLCTLVGRSLEAILCDRVITGNEVYRGNVENSVRQLVMRYGIDCADPIPSLVLGEEIGLDYELSFSGRGKTLSKRLYDILSPFNATYKIRCDFENGRLIFELCRGKDRRMNEEDTDFTLLSEKKGNFAEYTYSKVHMPYNRVYVYSNGQTAVYDISGGRDIREMYVYAQNAEKGEMSDSEFNDYLVSFGIQKLSAANKKPSFELTFDSSAYPRYGESFEVGDLCDVKIEPVGDIIEGRLSEINEHITASGVTLKGKFIVN